MKLGIVLENGREMRKRELQENPCERECEFFIQLSMSIGRSVKKKKKMGGTKISISA